MSRNTGNRGSKRKPIPKYEYHVSGSARVRIGYENYYLGEYDSPLSRQLYAVVIGEYAKLQEPPSAKWFKKRKKKLEKKLAAREAKRGGTKDAIEVCAVTAIWRLRVTEILAHNKDAQAVFENLCDLIDDEYGHYSVDQFRPAQLKQLRGLFVAGGNCRRYANEQTNRIKRIFQYAATEGDLIEHDVYQRLAGVAAIRKGQKVPEAGGKIPPEGRKVRPANLEHVRKTVEHLSPVLRAMVAILNLTGMRPSEVFRLTPGEVDRSREDVWVYSPEKHKTADREDGKEVIRAVPIIGEALEALRPFIDRGDNVCCFSPAESKQWYIDRRHTKRKTPMNQGDTPGSKADRRKRSGAAAPKRKPGKQWSKDSFRRAIHRGCEKAGVPSWNPYQLRHGTASTVEERISSLKGGGKSGREHVQALLGHKNISTSDNYVAHSIELATEAAKSLPELGIFRADDEDEAQSA